MRELSKDPTGIPSLEPFWRHYTRARVSFECVTVTQLPMAFSISADSSHSTLHPITSSFDPLCNNTEERPRKRARSQSPANEREDLSRSEGFPVFQHDPDYYLEDGSTVIRVEDVLFKVDIVSSTSAHDILTVIS
jgi:hypothetical protein